MTARPLILVVDDDGPILQLMRSVLREFGFDSVEASSGKDALAAARERKPDLVLVDKNMPGMTGEELISALRREPGLEQVPILILSGEPADVHRLDLIGANGAVQKPFDVIELIEQIRGFVNAPAAR